MFGMPPVGDTGAHTLAADLDCGHILHGPRSGCPGRWTRFPHWSLLRENAEVGCAGDVVAAMRRRASVLAQGEEHHPSGGLDVQDDAG